MPNGSVTASTPCPTTTPHSGLNRSTSAWMLLPRASVRLSRTRSHCSPCSAWPPDRARGGVEYICGRLADAPSRASAYESLRRDYTARALLDLPKGAWLSMLRAVLGCADPTQSHTTAGRGILLRLLVGEPLRSLFGDDDLISEIVVNLPEARV